VRVRVLLVLVLVAVAGCGSRTESSGACAAVLIWHDDVYVGSSLDGLKPGSPLADDAVVPGCNDGGRHEDDNKTEVQRVQGWTRCSLWRGVARHGYWRVRLDLAADSDVRLQRAGSAYIRDGTPIVVEGSECKLEGYEARLLARRILPA
jgi:hypothetical protein